MSSRVYDDSPSLLHVPLTPEEVHDLLLTDGSFLARDSRRIRHLLTRMRAAFDYEVQQRRNLQRDIEHMHAAARSRATPVSAALAALRQLSIDEQREVFDMRAQALLDAVESARGDAERARTAATSEANRARFALSRVLGDGDIPAEVKTRLLAALELIPDGTLQQQPPAPSTPPPAGGFAVPPREESSDLSDALFGAD